MVIKGKGRYKGCGRSSQAHTFNVLDENYNGIVERGIKKKHCRMYCSGLYQVSLMYHEHHKIKCGHALVCTPRQKQVTDAASCPSKRTKHDELELFLFLPFSGNGCEYTFISARPRQLEGEYDGDP